MPMMGSGATGAIGGVKGGDEAATTVGGETVRRLLPATRGGTGEKEERRHDDCCRLQWEGWGEHILYIVSVECDL